MCIKAHCADISFFGLIKVNIDWNFSYFLKADVSGIPISAGGGGTRCDIKWLSSLCANSQGSDGVASLKRFINLLSTRLLAMKHKLSSLSSRRFSPWEEKSLKK